MKDILFYLLIIFFAGRCFVHGNEKRNVSEEIAVDELYGHVAFLASDSLKGRKPGTPGCRAAAEYIRSRLFENGLRPLCENGFQSFKVVTSVEAGKGNYLSIGGVEEKAGETFIPLSFSGDSSLAAPVVFVGYGFSLNKDSLIWDDYENIDAGGKWVLILRGDPDYKESRSAFEAYSSIRGKILTAKDKGAGGALIVSGEDFDSADKLTQMRYDRVPSMAGIPVIHIKRTVADRLLKKSGKTIAGLEADMGRERKPLSFDTGVELDARTEVVKNKTETQNVAAILDGADDALKGEYLVIGAHYDHLGFGGPGSGSRTPDTLAVHNGADDNASGVSAILEIIERLAANRDKLRRSVIFIAFGAEEMGLLGSAYFVKNPPITMKDVKFMLNMDMIGRIGPAGNKLTLMGTGTAAGLEDLLMDIKSKYDMDVSFSPEGHGPTDHASFYMKDVPVINFFSGAHEDYHTPDDDIERVDFEGMKPAADLACDIIMEIAARDKALVFQEAGPKGGRAGGRMKLKATLGIMPDFTASSVKGLRAGAVIKDRPAYRAGMKKGDVIVALDGKPIGDIYEYMSRLKEFRPGDRINVDVMRDGKKVVLIVEL